MFFNWFTSTKPNRSTETQSTQPNRRIRVRRKLSDRRAQVRYQPGNPDRRKNPGRRRGDRDPWKQAAFQS